MPLADFGPDECGMLIRHTNFVPPPRLRPFPIGMLDFEHRIVSDPLDGRNAVRKFAKNRGHNEYEPENRPLR
jgi:hypothetical protein